MNNKYNDNNEYNFSLNELHFSEEEKANMVHKLLNADEKTAKRRTRRPLPRIAVIAVAATVVLGVGAGATGVLKSAGVAFSGVFGGSAAETEIMDKIGRPIGASDTDNGVTVTADAIIGDKHNYAITYTIAKDDGTAFDIDFNNKIDDKYLNVYFNQNSTYLGIRGGGAHGGSYFYDADPNDNAIQYVETWSYSEEVKPGSTAKAVFGDLSVLGGGMETGTASEGVTTASAGNSAPVIGGGSAEATAVDVDENGMEKVEDTASEVKVIAKGTWNLKFKMDFEDTSVSLPAGQSIEHDGASGTVNSVLLSPIGYYVDYTMNVNTDFAYAPSGKEPDSHEIEYQKINVPLSYTLTDGTVVDLSNSGTGSESKKDTTDCVKSGVFDEIIDVANIASVTVAGVTIPVK